MRRLIAARGESLRFGEPEWRRAYRACLAMLPLMLAALWWRLADSPNLPGDDHL